MTGNTDLLVELVPFDMQKEISVLLVTRLYPSEEVPYNGIQNKILFDMLGNMNVRMRLFRINTSMSFLRQIRSMRARIKEENIDIVQVSYGLKATLLGLFCPVPVVATYHGTDINGLTWGSRKSFVEWIALAVVARTVRQLSRFMDAVIVRTNEMKRRLPRAVQRKTSIIPMGIDTSIFKHIPRDDARRMLGWGSETVVAFSNGNNAGIKRQDLAEAAVEHLKQSVPGTRLHVIKNVEPAMVPVLLSASDCLVITSDKEGAPNILREAIGCGLPVVSVPVGDVPEVLARHPDAGIVVSRDPADIARGLLSVLQKDVKSELQGIEDISLDATARKVIDVYTKVLGTKPVA